MGEMTLSMARPRYLSPTLNGGSLPWRAMDTSESDRADIGEALLRELDARRNMARLRTIHVEREHGLRRALLGPANHPAQRRLASLGTQQTGLGADDGVA